MQARLLPHEVEAHGVLHEPAGQGLAGLGRELPPALVGESDVDAALRHLSARVQALHLPGAVAGVVEDVGAARLLAGPPRVRLRPVEGQARAAHGPQVIPARIPPVRVVRDAPVPVEGALEAPLDAPLGPPRKLGPVPVGAPDAAAGVRVALLAGENL